MPFDGSAYEGRARSLDKMDQVIELLSDEGRWCQRQIRSDDGRNCILGAMMAVDAVSELRKPTFLAIKQVTGRRHLSIEIFNDHPQTTHALVLKVLRQARENMLAGSPPATKQRVAVGDLWVFLGKLAC